MTVPPTESGEGDPGQFTRIAEEFIRLQEAGQLTDLDAFCARYPDDQRDHVRHECEQLLRLRGVIKQHNRLTAGQTLASYEILEQIGRGGMGEVYRARDTKLDRDVAIKVLPPELSCQPDRVKRFEREAKAIAALDHPNIVTIYSVEEVDGLHFIAMQLVQGKTLSELIPKKGLSMDKLFDLAIPLSDAISSAHEQGVIHRDLKPANIMVTSDGRVEILDFGLAKLTEHTNAEKTTKLRLSSLTEEGQVVGTVAYMSPEQAEGRDVDHRTDIFSLGIILYEMVTGERPFKGETRLALMSSIMREEPRPVTEVNAALPRQLGRIIARTLEKDSEQRFQTSKDLRNELTSLRKELDSGEVTAHVSPSGGRRWAVVSGVLVVVLMALLVSQFVLGGQTPPTDVVATQLTDQTGRQTWPSLSPDGRNLVYTDWTLGNSEIYRQRIGGQPTNLTEDRLEHDVHAAFDPAGDRIAFSSGNHSGVGIFVMGADGEDPRLILDKGIDPDWSPDGVQLVYGHREGNVDPNPSNPYSRPPGNPSQLWVVNVETREDRLLFADPLVDAFHPSWSPNDKRIAFVGRTDAQRDIWTIPTSGGEPVPVLEDLHTDWRPLWSADGRYLYFLTDRGPVGKPDLWRVPIDEDTGNREGDLEEVWAPPLGRVMEASISGNNIVCTLEVVDSWIGKIGFDPDTATVLGREEQIYFNGNEDLIELSLSPKGEWLAFRTYRGVENVFVVRPDGSDPPRKLTRDLDKNRGPTWYPDLVDGFEWLTFYSNREGPEYQVWRIRPSGIGLQRLTEGQNKINHRWMDGSHLSAFREASPGTGRRVIFQFPDGIEKPPFGPLLGGVYDTGETSWSPDQKLYAHRWLEGVLRVRSVSLADGVRQDLVGADGNPYRVSYQSGSRWLDDHRLIFWCLDRDRAYLWDVESEQATEIQGLDGPAEFVFSEDGKTLYMLRKTISSDIWLLETSK